MDMFLSRCRRARVDLKDGLEKSKGINIYVNFCSFVEVWLANENNALLGSTMSFLKALQYDF